MSLLKFSNIGIEAVAACVPPKRVENSSFTHLSSEEDLTKTIATTGIKERRFAEASVCASDLCFQAAQTVLEDSTIDTENIEALIFVSQTPDYRQPTTSTLLQHRLGLPKTTACFDLNMACSGYVYGLSFAYSMINAGMKKVLLLVGDTMSKITSQNDKATGLLFGDAGTASLITQDTKFGNAYFSLNADGGGAKALVVPAGGFRMPSNAQTAIETERADGSKRSEEQFFMEGLDVFNFSMTQAPKDLKAVLQFAEKEITELDAIVFHQANKYMTDFFAKKLRYDASKLFYCLEYYGNTSGSSIPLAICHNYAQVATNKQVALSGFGAGLSWATLLVEDFDKIKATPITEYNG